MRELKAIIRKTFGSKRHNRSKLTLTTIAIWIGFIVALFSVASSIVYYFRGMEPEIQLNPNVIVVNPSGYWCDYLHLQVDVDEVRKGNDVILHYGTDEELKGTPFDGREFNGDLIFTTWEAYYDIFTFDEWMEKYNAKLVIVFSSDFDEVVQDWSNSEKPDILTYYPSTNAEYRDYEERFSYYFLEDGFLKYIQFKLGIPFADGDLINSEEISVGTDYDMRTATKIGMARNIIPFFFFIAILYTSMLSGMDVIAGEKERGTFASVLMTPVPRMTIILGDYIGVFLHTMVPSSILFAMVLMSHFDCGISGFIAVALLVISLALFVCGITLIVSCLNNSIVQAQTTFLPVFLIFLVVCVTCMQNGSIDENQFYLPIYGHFYGIGNSLMGEIRVFQLTLNILYSLVAALICIIISSKLLNSEQFTVAVESQSNREIRRMRKIAEKQKKDYVSIPRANVFGYVPFKRKSAINFFIQQALLPVLILSIFQPLGMIPALISYLRNPASVSFFTMFRGIKDNMSADRFQDIMKTSIEVFNMFMRDRNFIFFMGISYWVIILIYILIVKGIEHNKLSTIGLTKMPVRRALKEYFKGMGIGFILICGVYLILLITGQVRINGFALESGAIPLFIAYILMWLPQGATEEIMFRGYMMPRVASRFGITFAVFFTSLCFGLMHGTNIGFSYIALFNLTLIAALFAYIALKSGHIYMVCAMHTVWNFCQGNIFGLEVSGSRSSATLLASTYTTNAKDLLTGGTFGPEGGLAVTIVMAVTFIIVYCFFNRKSPKA